MLYIFNAPTAITDKNPRKNINEPNNPKKCIGFLPNLPVNHNVAKSR